MQITEEPNAALRMLQTSLRVRESIPALPSPILLQPLKSMQLVVMPISIYLQEPALHAQLINYLQLTQQLLIHAQSKLPLLQELSLIQQLIPSLDALLLARSARIR